ncbi:MAG: NepR family anti-sigma factor [Flavobacteriaceae bacterium]
MDDQDKAGSSKSRRTPLTENPNDAISRKLQALYSSLEQEEIPPRFLDLLEKLDEAEQASGASGSRSAGPRG